MGDAPKWPFGFASSQERACEEYLVNVV